MEGCGRGNRGGFSLDFAGRYAIGASVGPTSPGSPSSDGRRVVDEMDFFSREKSKERIGSEPLDPKLCVKSEDLAVNTGLQLSGSGHSMLDVGLPPMNEQSNVEGKSEMAAIKDEVARKEEENQRLRSTLNQMNASYNSLHFQLVAAMQQNSIRNGSSIFNEEDKTFGITILSSYQMSAEGDCLESRIGVICSNPMAYPFIFQQS